MATKETKDVVKEYLTEAWYSFKHALNPDTQTKTQEVIMKDNGMEAGIHQRLTVWFKKYWGLSLFALMIIRFFWVSVRSSRPSRYRDGRRSHHGINKWGQRY